MRSLVAKLVLAFLLINVVGTALVALYVARATTTEFGEFVANQYFEQMADRYAEHYRLHDGWVGVAEIVSSSPLRIFGDPGGGREPARPPSAFPFRAPSRSLEWGGRVLVVDQEGRAVVAGLGFEAGEQVDAERIAAGSQIVVDGTVVGALITIQRPWTRVSPRHRFLAAFYEALTVGSIGATVLALALGVVLARSLTKPVRELTAATRAMARGELSQSISVRSRDELGELTRSFNQMSAELVRARDGRRQMTADIAHELRTPLSLILGHAEALSDGVLPPSAETFEIIHDEAQRLARLVGDLRTLSLSDAGELTLHRQPVALGALVRQTATAHQAQAQARQIALIVEADPALPTIDLDPDRIIQVLNNLLSNALRYTPEGGRIALSATSADDVARLTVQDSGPGIAEDDLPHVFERFYRSDKSRQRLEGGSGLGLAIARSLVEAHGGRIWAESEPGLGTTFIVALPISPSRVARDSGA